MKNDNSIAIRLSGVSKRYTIHHEKPTLVERLAKGRDEEFWALKDINLTIRKGERVGIIGPNGSGKTTLLKVIAGIATPTSGWIQTNGRIVSLIGIDAGFHDDLNGEQNIFLNGMLLGMSKSEIEAKLASIIRFADIGKFIDAAMFTYSDGMKLRLGFSIAIHANPAILILDESMSAGDKKFRVKSQAKLQEFFRKGITILVVSHWLEYIKKNCQRIILMNHGKILNDGNIAVATRYQQNTLLFH